MARLRELVADPPISDRLVWQGLLKPEARDFGDLAVTASAFGLVFSVGGIAGLLTTPLDPLVERPALFAVAAAGFGLLGLVCLVGYRRLPRLFFPAAAAAGIGLASVAAIACERGSEAVVAPAYAVIFTLGALFMTSRWAVAEGALALGAYGWLLFGRDTPYAAYLLVSSAAMLVLIGMLIGIVRTRTQAIAVDLSADAYMDPLTGIPNRRSFDARYELERARSARDQGPVSLVLCDLDHFKRVNDERGHEVGDEVLCRAANAITQATRAVDLAARIGGEEFGLILPGAAEEQAAVAAERVRRRVSAEFASDPFDQTVSCGVACLSGADDDPETLFRNADRALYEAKRAGRDCTAVADATGNVRVIGGGTAIGRLRQWL